MATTTNDTGTYFPLLAKTKNMRSLAQRVSTAQLLYEANPHPAYRISPERENSLLLHLLLCWVSLKNRAENQHICVSCTTKR